MLKILFIQIFLLLFQPIRNQHQILRMLTIISKLVEQIIFVVIIALFANFEAERAQNSPKKRKIFFSNMNQNKLYFLILVSDKQVVKPFHPNNHTYLYTYNPLADLNSGFLRRHKSYNHYSIISLPNDKKFLNYHRWKRLGSMMKLTKSDYYSDLLLRDLFRLCFRRRASLRLLLYTEYRCSR
jgi:hypothetical protein